MIRLDPVTREAAERWEHNAEHLAEVIGQSKNHETITYIMRQLILTAPDTLFYHPIQNDPGWSQKNHF